MKYWKVCIGGTRMVFLACKVETAIKNAIRLERKRIRERSKEIGKKLSLSDKLEIFTEETSKSYYDECVKANLPKESAENDKKEDEEHG